MAKLTPGQKIRLKHAFDLDPAGEYLICCTYNTHEFEATGLDGLMAAELLATLQNGALAASRRRSAKPAPPILLLDSVFRTDVEDGDGDPEWLPSAFDYANQNCIDCDVNTITIGEYYMVDWPLWAATVPEGPDGGMLCIGCFEQRLGRELRRPDFIDAPINWLENDDGWSERMRARLGTTGELTNSDLHRLNHHNPI